MKKAPLNILVVFSLSVQLSCTDSFLDAKPDAKLAVPSTLEDYNALLDNRIMYSKASITLGVIGADEYYINDGRLTTLTNAYQRNAYTWRQDIFEGGESDDWNQCYQRILYANLALDAETKDFDKTLPLYKTVIGSALFYRAHNYYILAQHFCKVYSPASSTTDKGLPLKLDYDVSVRPKRSSMDETYRQIQRDALRAYELLPEKAVDKYRPNKAAAALLLTRLHMQMANYEEAEKYADAGLKLADQLVDLNTVNASEDYPFPDQPDDNPEILVHLSGALPAVIGLARFNISNEIFSSYAPDDLRSMAYFFRHSNGATVFGGGKVKYHISWVGLATDELWLCRAECRIRTGKIEEGLGDLNHLLKYRYVTGTSPHYTSLPQTDALALVLQERKKELVMRGVRWEDLRRLNRDNESKTDLRREIDGEMYVLKADDPRWTWPIPDNEIALSGIEQNER